jgi:flavin-dependent dehydrogenase
MDCLGPVGGASRLYSAPACSGALASSCGRGWLAIGDAAQSWDPLSGQGITRALSSALVAVEVLESGRSVGRALDRYADRARADFRNFLRARSVYYGRETRWPESPFWRRRAQAG